MTPNIPCYLIRDLLPTYVDGLTSEETSHAIETHIAACEACRAALDEMRTPAPVETTPTEAPEVDYLKKVRRDGNRRSLRNALILGVVLAAVVLAAVWRLLPRQMSGIIDFNTINEIDATFYTVDLYGGDATYRIEDASRSELYDSFHPSQDFASLFHVLTEMKVRPGFRNLLPNDTAGVTSGDLYDQRSLFLSLHGSGDNMNRGVRLFFLDPETLTINFPDGTRKIYYVTDPACFEALAAYLSAHGGYFGTEAAELAPFICEYTGQLASVEGMIETFHWEDTFGQISHTTTLKDDWTVTLHDVVSTAHEEELLRTMQRDSFILLGLVGDMETVTWRYECGGETKTQVYTVSDADAHVARPAYIYPGGTPTTSGSIKSFVDFTDRTDAVGVQNLLDAIDGVAMR